MILSLLFGLLYLMICVACLIEGARLCFFGETLTTKIAGIIGLLIGIIGFIVLL